MKAYIFLVIFMLFLGTLFTIKKIYAKPDSSPPSINTYICGLQFTSPCFAVWDEKTQKYVFFICQEGNAAINVSEVYDYPLRYINYFRVSSFLAVNGTHHTNISAQEWLSSIYPSSDSFIVKHGDEIIALINSSGFYLTGGLAAHGSQAGCPPDSCQEYRNASGLIGCNSTFYECDIPSQECIGHEGFDECPTDCYAPPPGQSPLPCHCTPAPDCKCVVG